MRFTTPMRYELKYLVNAEQRLAVIDALADYMEPDVHSDKTGHYPITSLYFDTADHRAYWDKLEGHRDRRKVRVRVYGEQVVTPESACFLEIKHRRNKRMSKRRVALRLDQAMDFAGLGELSNDFDGRDRSILREVHYLGQTLQLRPSCVVSYNRLAFNGKEPYSDLRVTFDTELKGRGQDLDLLSTGRGHDLYFLPPEICIMEVKVNQSAPYWLTQIIAEQMCVFRRISKYCSALEQCDIIRQKQRIIARN